MSSDKEPLGNSLPLILVGLIMWLTFLATAVEPIFHGVSELMGGIANEALEVNFAPGVAFAAFAMILFVGLTITSVLQLFKIKAPDYVLVFIVNCMVFGVLAGFSARIVSPYAVGYYLESKGYSFCEHRTVRGYREGLPGTGTSQSSLFTNKSTHCRYGQPLAAITTPSIKRKLI